MLEEAKKINPLLRFNKNKVPSISIDKDECTITLSFEAEKPLTIWFRSLAELNQAYAEWEMEAKKGGGEAGKKKH